MKECGRRQWKTANLAAFLHIIDTSRLLGILRADKTAIIHAASKAEQAFNYMLAFGDDQAGTSRVGSLPESNDLLVDAA